jgi:hypothetical protein
MRLRKDAQKLREERATLEGTYLTAWEKMLRMKRKMRMLTMEEMPLHPLLLHHLQLPHLRRSSWRKTLRDGSRTRSSYGA